MGFSDGRHPKNAVFDFHRCRVLEESEYVQHLLSQSRCRILAGKHMPVWPGVDGSDCTHEPWAKLIMCNFVPWDMEKPPSFTGHIHCKYDGANYLKRSRFSRVGCLKKIARYDCVQKTLANDIRKRPRKIWGARHPLDVNYNANKEMEEMKETRAELRIARLPMQDKGCKKLYKLLKPQVGEDTWSQVKN